MTFPGTGTQVYTGNPLVSYAPVTYGLKVIVSNIFGVLVFRL